MAYTHGSMQDTTLAATAGIMPTAGVRIDLEEYTEDYKQALLEIKKN